MGYAQPSLNQSISQLSRNLGDAQANTMPWGKSCRLTNAWLSLLWLELTLRPMVCWQIPYFQLVGLCVSDNVHCSNTTSATPTQPGDLVQTTMPTVPHNGGSNTSDAQGSALQEDGGNLCPDEDDHAGIVDECPGLAHSDVKLACRPGEWCMDFCYKMR